MFLFKPSKQPFSRNYDLFHIGVANHVKNDKLQNFSNSELIYNFISIFASIFLSSVGYGILMVLIAIKAEKHIKNEILISISTITQIGAGVFFAKFLPNIRHND